MVKIYILPLKSIIMVKKNIETINLDGGSLCLDFINTINDRFVSDPLDYLGNAQDLVE